jgi:hypothetical protein
MFTDGWLSTWLQRAIRKALAKNVANERSPRSGFSIKNQEIDAYPAVRPNSTNGECFMDKKNVWVRYMV